MSAEIIDRDRARPARRAVVPNGVEPIGVARPAARAARRGSPRSPGPRAVYVGTLDSRLDVPGIIDLAARRPRAPGRPARPAAPTPRTWPTSACSRTCTSTRASRAPSSSRRCATPTSACSPTGDPAHRGDEPAEDLRVPRGGRSGRRRPTFRPCADIDDRVLLVDGVGDFADVDRRRALALGPARRSTRTTSSPRTPGRRRHETGLRARASLTEPVPAPRGSSAMSPDRRGSVAPFVSSVYQSGLKSL